MWLSLSVTCNRFSPVSSTNKTDHHESARYNGYIVESDVLNTTTLTPQTLYTCLFAVKRRWLVPSFIFIQFLYIIELVNVLNIVEILLVGRLAILNQSINIINIANDLYSKKNNNNVLLCLVYKTFHFWKLNILSKFWRVTETCFWLF